jgi:cytoskeletal protein RodZ
MVRSYCCVLAIFVSFSFFKIINDETHKMSESSQTQITGQAASKKNRKKRVIRIGRKEVILGGLLLAGGLAVGAIAWQFSKYWLIDKRYEMMADKAVQAIKATGETIEKLDEAGYGPRTISQITND